MNIFGFDFNETYLNIFMFFLYSVMFAFFFFLIRFLIFTFAERREA